MWNLLLCIPIGVAVMIAYLLVSSAYESYRFKRVLKSAWEDIERKSNHDGRN